MSRPNWKEARAIDRVFPGDPRYGDLAARNAYGRAPGRPDVFYVVRTSAEVCSALGDAVSRELHVAPRCGGQCHEDFTANPSVRAVIDASLMSGVAWDRARKAFKVDCGTSLGELYRSLFLGWGVMLPAGVAPEVAVGGHILGGGFGYFARQHGLAADHLEAVEVAVVGGKGESRLVIASRDPADPNHDLWWAHTGGGGGNFGIVTRYWLRSPGASGDDPAQSLPRPPRTVTRFSAAWPWASLDEARFSRLVRNHGAWCEANSVPGAVATRLFATLALSARGDRPVAARGVCTTDEGAQALIEGYIAALTEGVSEPPRAETEVLSWLAFALDPVPGMPRATGRPRLGKVKDAFWRRGPSDDQIATIYRHLVRGGAASSGGMLGFATYGGAVNAVPWNATASAQRDAVMTMYCTTSWSDPADEAARLAWVRDLYHGLFEDTGGVPVPETFTDGAFINHPDSDLADPRWNRSGVPWHELYYKGNYPRLQRAKARWDPLNIFHHALSIRAPAVATASHDR